MPQIPHMLLASFFQIGHNSHSGFGRNFCERAIEFDRVFVRRKHLCHWTLFDDLGSQDTPLRKKNTMPTTCIQIASVAENERPPAILDSPIEKIGVARPRTERPRPILPPEHDGVLLLRLCVTITASV